MKEMKGFTLIELMITVAIIGILAGIAYPMYGDYLTRTYRGDCANALQRMAGKQEELMLRMNGGNYTTDVTNIGGSSTKNGYYTVSVKSADAKGFVLQCDAVAGGPQENDTACKTLTFSSTGLKAPAGCWP